MYLLKNKSNIKAELIIVIKSTTEMLITMRLGYVFSLSANFAVLGLKTTTKMDEVKKKYYELAKVYHPDVNSGDQNSHKKFAEITKAYKYIVQNYDQQKGYYQTSSTKSETKDQKYSNQSKFKNQKRQKTRVQQEQYEDFYQYDVFYKHGKKFRKPKIGEDIYISLKINLQESILGTYKPYTYTKYQPCSSCAAKQFSSCFSCGGKGQIYDRLNRQKVRCEYCSGKGFKNQCLQCLGASYVLKETSDKIYIQKGTKDKSILKIEKKGHSGYKAENGDLYITIFVEQSSKFKVDGNNIHMDYQLDFVTAACGGKVMVETVYGLKELDIEAGTQSGSEIRMFDAGLKSPFSKRLGDQIIKIKIKIPERLSQKQKSLLQKLMESER